MLYTCRFLQVLREYLDGQNVEADLRAALPEELREKSDSPEVIAPIDVFEHLLDSIAEETKIRSLGWEIGFVVPKGTYGVMEFCFRTASTFADALELLPVLMARINPYALDIDAVGNETRVVLREPEGGTETHRHLNEYQIAAFMKVFSFTLGAEFEPTRVLFAHPAATSFRIREVLNCDVEFNAAGNGFLIDQKTLESPLLLHDPALHEHMRKASEVKPKTTSVAQRLQDYLEQASPEDATVALAAKQLAMSERTLHRRLKEEGTTFQEIRDSVRKNRAHRLLTTTKKSMQEIAEATGFATAAAFSRAVKRWFKKTPGAIRKS